ncbi:uncharacterized protein STEHIDRAFT_166720 [Stereum hirsutum FP-91666 SS1]|uniref:uncharacterized protein n=1 Tax=Stereum hirsutum (strain FP-91666) TaxID=721885 RepID=UPI000440F370|nr:uncharacterized protein STEHIDRAFT_166720 [Stereum hirsutum FP-91666 SS1]EIM88695.1 hypothetical protein STEHIDRAFT_166720 [Stereum hirsutum FP-91666 SS1]
MAAPPVTNPIVLDLSNTAGATLISLFISSALWGVSCVQMFTYFYTYGDSDGRVMKFGVAFLWALNTANEALTATPEWRQVISNWGSLEVLAQFAPEFMHAAWTSILLSAVVQLVFIRRIYLLSGKKSFWIAPCAFLVLITVYQLAVTIAWIIIGFQSGITSHSQFALALSIRCCTTADDVLIAAAIIYLLLRNGWPKFRKSRQQLLRLVMVTINSGAWTALFALLTVIFMSIYPSTLVSGVFDLSLPALHLTSLLANLNSRRYVRGQSSASSSSPSDPEWNECTSAFDSGSRSGYSSGERRPSTSVYPSNAFRLKGRGATGETKTTMGIKTENSVQFSPSTPKARGEFESVNAVSPVVAILKPESMDYDGTDTHRFYRQSEEHNASNRYGGVEAYHIN